MDSKQEKLLEWKANKSRVVRIYNLYKHAEEQDPNITLQLWFWESYKHVSDLYEQHREFPYIVMNYSQKIFVNDAEYRINEWYIHQMENN